MAQKSTKVSLRRTAAEVKRYRRLKRIIPAGIGIGVLILVIGYVLSVMYMKFGAFTVMVNKYDQLDYALTLSASQNFATPTSRLNAEISEEITNIDGRNLPADLDNIDGEHNGDNYIAYTFYCKNAGVNTINYTYDLYIANMTLDVEKAARIRLYVDGEYTDYAYPRTDGGEGPEPGTTAFQSKDTVVKQTVRDFAPGDVTKFTVVIWLEGNDPECVNRILGGQMKVDMAIEVVSADTGEESGAASE
ncbi:MAG: hypothetical protein J5793_02190 [Clostridia bacterium]|nr:hypothetical protein [Clostridia bacterium]